MSRPAMLDDHAVLVTQARAQLDHVILIHKQEIEGPRSVWARLKDWVSDTPSELAIAETTQALEQSCKEARRTTVTWLDGQQEAWLASSGMEQPRALKTSLDHRQARLDKFSNLHSLSRQALSALDTAAERCSSASTMETIDMISSNKGLSLLSTIETGEASDDVETAKRAVTRLQKALKRTEQDPELMDVGSDLPDLAIDMMFDVGLDVLSFFNMLALDESEQSCRDAYDKLKPLHERLEQLKTTASSATDRARTDFESVRRPMLEQWLQQVPQPLVALLPPSHAPSAGFAPLLADRRGGQDHGSPKGSSPRP